MNSIIFMNQQTQTAKGYLFNEDIFYNKIRSNLLSISVQNFPKNHQRILNYKQSCFTLDVLVKHLMGNFKLLMNFFGVSVIYFLIFEKFRKPKILKTLYIF